MNFSFLTAMLIPGITRRAPAPAPETAPVLQAIRAVSDYAEALANGAPVDEAALAYARCVLEQGRHCEQLAGTPDERIIAT